MSELMAALRLQVEWGADEAVAETARDWFAGSPARPERPRPAAVRTAAEAVAPAAQAGTLEFQASTLEFQASTLDALWAAWEAAPGLRLRETATRAVWPSGPAAARLLLLADAPSVEDDRSGQAFAGVAGGVLDRVLGSIGLERGAMMLGFMSPWRPPGGRPLSAAEVQACLPFVRRLIALQRPGLVVLVGGTAVQALTGETARRARGKQLRIELAEAAITVAAVSLPPLDQWLNDGSSKQRLWMDLIFLQRTVTTG